MRIATSTSLKYDYISFVKLIILILTSIFICFHLSACENESATPQATPSLTVALEVATQTPPKFDGKRAFQDLKHQLSLGPRTPESKGHEKVRGWIEEEVVNAGWEFETQISTYNEHNIYNLVAKRGSGHPWIILGAHYDTRYYADQDPNPANRKLPVPGANDGASGVSVLTELARILPLVSSENLKASQIWLVFFDWEDQGNIDGNSWIIGSTEFSKQLKSKPDAVVIIDMIGDKFLNIYPEKNSDQVLNKQIWDTAKQLGYENIFLDESKFSILDDHIPFVNAGIPAVDLIDFEYPVWHTTADIEENVSSKSLQAIGDTLFAWLKKNP